MPTRKETTIESLLRNVCEIEDAISPMEAAKIVGVSKPTVITWCEKYRIGIKVGGRWKVDPKKLELLLKGSMHSHHSR